MTSSISINSSPGTGTTAAALQASTSFKSFHKLASHSYTNSSNFVSFSYNTPPGGQVWPNNNNNSNEPVDHFVMPAVAPSKDEWVKDENVNECMVCQTGRFNLLNRRHHCRRCGRVVCSNCSQKVTLIENVPRRACDDCFAQTERLKFHENRLKSDQHQQQICDSLVSGARKSAGLQRSGSTSLDSTGQQHNTLIDDTINNWQLIGNGGDGLVRDDLVRASFRYQQAPSTSLCLSILDLHDQLLECGKDLLSMADELSSYLSAANYQVDNFTFTKIFEAPDLLLKY